MKTVINVKIETMHEWRDEVGRDLVDIYFYRVGMLRLPKTFAEKYELEQELQIIVSTKPSEEDVK